MKKALFAIVLSFAALDAAPLAAAPCDGAPPKINRLALNEVAPTLDAKADEINAWWVEGRNDIELSEAIKQRQQKIDQVYQNLREERRKLYSGLSCEFHSSKRCCSTPGRRRTCPITEEPPSANVEFGSLQINGDDFDQSPTLSGRSASYIVKKTGNGCNTGGFSTRVVYRDGAISKFVDEDIELVRAYFQRKVALSNPDGGIVSPGSTGSRPQCANLAEELSKLSDLKKNNDLSEKEFEAAKAAILNACSR